MNGLKELLCDKTLGIAGMDQQIQELLDFYEGKATFGKVGNVDGHDVYDGDHYWHVSVSDDESVENGKPTRTSIDVIIENIETDTGEIYKIQFNANLLYESDEASIGITQITITDNIGRKQVIGEKLD